MQISKVKQSGTFDFNNPTPQKYDHQEYPRMMYRGAQSRQAHNLEEQEEAIAHGWFLTKTEALEAADDAADPRLAHPAEIEDEDEDTEQEDFREGADIHEVEAPAHHVAHKATKKHAHAPAKKRKSA